MSDLVRPTRIVIISGTNRAGSQTRRLSGFIHALHAAVPGVEVELLDLCGLPAALLSPDAYRNKPADFAPFADAVLRADGLVVVCPEYNGGPPGALKLFIDMLPFPVAFERRPVAFVGLAAGRWGALRAVEQLQGVFGYRNALMFPNRVFIPAVGDALGLDGAPHDPALVAMLTAQAHDFVLYARQVAPLRPPQA
jgi:chromate reductase